MSKINFDIFSKGNEKKVFLYKGQQIEVYLDIEKEQEFIKFIEQKLDMKTGKINIDDGESMRFLLNTLTNLETKGFTDKELLMILQNTNDLVLTKIVKEIKNLMWVAYEKIIDNLEEKINDLELQSRQKKAFERLNNLAEKDGITVEELIRNDTKEEVVVESKPKVKTKKTKKEVIINENKDKK